MNTIKQLSENVIFHQDYRLGSLLDQSTNSKDGTATSGVKWSCTNMGKCLMFNGVGGKVSLGSDVVGTGDVTFCAWVQVDGWGAGTAGRIFDNSKFCVFTRSAGINSIGASNNGGSTAVYASTDEIELGDAVFVAITRESNKNINFYINGVQNGTADQDGGSVSTGSTMYVGDRAGDDRAFEGYIHKMVMFDTILTSEQIAKLHEEYLITVNTGTLQKRNFQHPQAIGNGNFTEDVLWTKGTGWSIANAKASCDGSQTELTSLQQDVAVEGKFYTIKYSVSNRSAGQVRASMDGNAGTYHAADGVYTEYLRAEGGTNVRIDGDVDFIGDIDWVKVSEGNSCLYNNNFEDAPVTLGTSSGELGGFMVYSGTWNISEDSNGKWLTNVSVGSTSIQNSQAYGTWQWDYVKVAAGSVVQFDFVNTQHDGDGNGYRLRVNASEAINFQRIASGGSTTLATSSNACIVTATKYTFRVTRNLEGVFTWYIKGGAYAVWTKIDASVTGTNPVTDSTYTTGDHFSFEISTAAGDKISNIKCWEGVLDPIE